MESRPPASSAFSSPVAEGKRRGRSSAGDRRPLAIMACETCRARKSRCDKQRPRCGLCQKLGKTCTFQEPKPIKSVSARLPVCYLDIVPSLMISEVEDLERQHARPHFRYCEFSPCQD